MNTSYDSDRNGSPLADNEKSIEFDIRTEEIYFADQSSGYYCVCIVDMVNSSQITAKIADGNKIRKYYEIFLNAMAALAKNFGSKVIKNVGDALLFYFPDTSDTGNVTAFKEVLECCTAIIAAHEFINIRLEAEALPPVNYRISADYGRVEVATTVTSGTKDLFGPTVNMCAKINSQAEPNGIVVGGDLHEIMKRFSFREYSFEGIEKKQLIGIRYSYPVYSVVRKDEVPARDNALNVFKKDTHKPKFREETLSIYPRKALQPRDDIISHSYPKQTSRPTVMLVDDEPDILAIFKTYLTSEGYEVEAFSDSYMALQSFARSEPRHYDLLVLDIRMPTINGLQLYQRLKAVDPYVRVIFMSALEATDELVSILDGVKTVDVIRKPIDRKHFIQKVNATIESSHSGTNS
ncbi:MAG TPA: response regulator [Nitrososphaera sp.]|nr:response regulator [Nitrososphaera sp.]